jgi:hypothetical protein
MEEIEVDEPQDQVIHANVETLTKFDLSTPQFKGIMDDLPGKERKAFAGLLELKCATAAEIGKVSRLSSNIVSAFMARLVERGLVKVAVTGKTKTYQVFDADFSTWYSLRRRQGGK